MEIRYSKEAYKRLKRYDKKTRRRILNGINGLTQAPPKGDIKPLKGSNNELRLVVGKYRVVYEYLANGNLRILMINNIDSRGDVYK
ncbi:MAG: type II toxin-antitoxin system RelE/ParE family toxin [Clostridiales bacterium]|jgi:mRNA interferase RelE/StbE|nr:type II toxin-antitoxin system RelE/ParE family toxin [Clostridiales bacterium]